MSRTVHRRAAMVTAAAATLVPARQGSGAGPPVRVAWPDRPGGTPPGFSFARTGPGAPGLWTLIADPESANSTVLAQISGDTTAERFPLAIYDGLTAADLRASVRFKAVSGRVDCAGGLAIRLKDAGNYYVVRADAIEDNTNLYRVIGGVRRHIAGASSNVTSNTWHTLAITAAGTRFSISLDGRALFTVTDRTLSGPGKVALWTRADSVTYFDELTITPQG